MLTSMKRNADRFVIRQTKLVSPLQEKHKHVCELGTQNLRARRPISHKASFMISVKTPEHMVSPKRMGPASE